MSINELIKKTCRILGENNKPTYVVMAIAAVKGIFRPLFTMMDKKENPETKKYTAVREGLTEAIAIPAYWGCGELAAKGASKLFKNKALAKRAETNLMFLGVCTAALFVIPAACSLAIKPMMGMLGFKNPSDKKIPDASVKNQPIEHEIHRINKSQTMRGRLSYSSYNTFSSRPQTGLRVGGV